MNTSRRNTLFLLALFLGLSLLFWLSRKDAEPVSDRNFKVSNPNQIYRIVLTHRDGERTELLRKDGTWWYQGNYRANPNVMENLLDAVSRIQIRYVPPRAALPLIQRDLAEHGIHVELFDQRDRKLIGYFVGGSTADERGTHLMREGGQSPFVGELAGWEGNLRFRFRMRGDEWRDKTIIQYQVGDLVSVRLTYPRQTEASFSLRQQEGRYLLETVSGSREPITIAPSRAATYLREFRSLGAEAFENGNPHRDSIERSPPFVRIDLQERGGKQRTLSVWPIYPVDRLPGGGIVPRRGGVVERYFVSDGEDDFYLIQDRVFRKIFRGYDFFNEP